MAFKRSGVRLPLGPPSNSLYFKDISSRRPIALFSYPEHIRRDENWTTFQLAVSIILHFFDKEWVENNIIQGARHSRPAGFFRMDFSSDFEREKRAFRVLDFAETLFNLQHVPGFDDRVDQTRTRPVEATFAVSV